MDIINLMKDNCNHHKILKPENQWSCKRSPDIWFYCKYKNKFRKFVHCLKMGQGQHSVIIYINFVELENILLHTMFHQDVFIHHAKNFLVS